MLSPNWIKWVYSILLLLLLKQEVAYMCVVSRSVGEQVRAREETRAVVQTLNPGSYKIIVSQYYGSPFPEYAIMQLYFSKVVMQSDTMH